MKSFLVIVFIVFSNNIFAKDLTDNFVALKLNYNQEKKYYEVSFSQMAGVYKADEKFIKCLQTSLESQKPAKVTYQPMGLKLTGCAN